MTPTNEIADKFASEQNLTKAQAKAIVETIFASITAAALSRNIYPGSCKFKIKDTLSERCAIRRPAPPSRLPLRRRLHPTAKALKDLLNN